MSLKLNSDGCVNAVNAAQVSQWPGVCNTTGEEVHGAEECSHSFCQDAAFGSEAFGSGCKAA